MLPVHIESERPSFAASPSFSEYMRRMIHYAQMDISYTFAQMLYLCFAPRKVYQLTSYRKQTKNQWARDDPAFIVVIIFFLVIAGISYSVALQVRGLAFLRILCVFIGLQFVATGAVIATISWIICNKYLRVQSFHGVEQRMEWMYAFDIHCNSFFPLFLVLYVLHYLLLPYIIQPTFGATILSNLLYALAIGYYSYITSLGYSTLPFLERTEVFLYPSVVIVGIIMCCCLLGINLTRVSMYFLAG